MQCGSSSYFQLLTTNGIQAIHPGCAFHRIQLLLSSFYDWSSGSTFIQCLNRMLFLHLSSSPHPLPLQAGCIFLQPLLRILSGIKTPILSLSRSLDLSLYVRSLPQRSPSSLGDPTSGAGIILTMGRAEKVIRRFVCSSSFYLFTYRYPSSQRISYWGVPAWDGMNPLNALGNSWIYKRNHSPSRHSRHFSRSPKFNKRSPMPVDDPEPLTLPLMAGPPLLPNGPNTLTNPLDGLTPPDVANATATVVDGGSGSPLVGEFNGGVAIGTVVRKRERSYPDTSSQRVMETSHDESEQGLGLGVGLELGLGLGGYREDDRTFSYEQDNPHDNAGDDNQAGNHPHARPAASPSKPIGNNHPKPNHGNEDIREDIHEHIHKHIHSSKRDGGADVPGTVDIVVRLHSFRFYTTNTNARVAEHAKQHENRISRAWHWFCEWHKRKREYHGESLCTQRIRDEPNNSLSRPRL